MPIHELAALGAAVCWALTGIISAGPAGHLGAPAFNRVRQIFVTAMLALYVLATGSADPRPARWRGIAGGWARR